MLSSTEYGDSHNTVVWSHIALESCTSVYRAKHVAKKICCRDLSSAMITVGTNELKRAIEVNINFMASTGALGALCATAVLGLFKSRLPCFRTDPGFCGTDQSACHQPQMAAGFHTTECQIPNTDQPMSRVLHKSTCRWPSGYQHDHIVHKRHASYTAPLLEIKGAPKL